MHGIISLYDEYGSEYLRVNSETGKVVFKKTFVKQELDLEIIDSNQEWPDEVNYTFEKS